MDNLTKASIKIQSIWKSYRIRNLRKYMTIKHCYDCKIYYKVSSLSGSELDSNIPTCGNCLTISRHPTATCLLDNNDIEGLKYMNQLYKRRTLDQTNISRTPTATCIVNDDVISNSIFDKEFLDDNMNDSSAFGEYQQAGITF